MSRVKRLFMLRHGRGGQPVKDEQGQVIYFNDKMIAKKARLEDQVVSYGPDHKLYKGEA
jgi:hypothetical protein